MKTFIIHSSLAFILSLVFISCGGSGSSSSSNSNLSLQANVSLPANANLSLPMLGISKSRGLFLRTSAVTEDTASGIAVHAENADGDTIGTGCTTGALGTCEIADLTAAELEAGVTLVAMHGEVPIHSFVQVTDTEITDAAGEPIEAPINTATDMSKVIADVINETTPMDLDCMAESLATMVGGEDDAPTTDDNGGYMQALYEAHAASIITGGADGEIPADILAAALGGDTTPLVAVAGDAIDDVPLADAVTNSLSVMGKMAESACVVEDGATYSPFRLAKIDSDTAGETFDPLALMGPFKAFIPGDMDELEPADMRAFMRAVPGMTGGSQMFRHPGAYQTIAEGIKQGSFRDASLAGRAIGSIAAFLPPPEAGTYRMDFDGFDPQSAARGGQLFFLGLKENGLGNDVTPDTIFNQFNATFADESRRQSFMNGGTASFDGFTSFVRDPSGFRPADHFADFKAPPGSACADDGDCLPCDSCTNSVCTSLSTKMGLACTDNTSCDSITNCVGGFHPNAVKQCMCGAGVPSGAFIQEHSGQDPQAFGQAGGFARPVDGAPGFPCGTGQPACLAGNRCSGNEHGVCLPAAFKKGPYAPCAADNECLSEDCAASGVCSTLSSEQMQQFNSGHEGNAMAGNKSIGQACNAPPECSSFFCIAGVCTNPPGNHFDDANRDDMLKADGQACTMPFECASHVCVGTCQAGGGGGGPPTNLPAGRFCLQDPECASLHCNHSSNQCM